MPFNRLNSAPFCGMDPIPLASLNDLQDWNLNAKNCYQAAVNTLCYDLDSIAQSYSSTVQVGIEPLRTLATPDVLIIEEDSYTFVEFKTTDFSRNNPPTQLKIICQNDPIFAAQYFFKDLLLKHLSAKIAGAAMYSAITSADLHGLNYKYMFRQASTPVRLYIVIKDAQQAASFTSIFKSTIKGFGNFGFSVQLCSIDYFLSDVLGSEIVSVL